MAWAWWKAAIKAKNEGQALPPVSPDQPEVGFYYAKASRAGGRVPVCIYPDNNGDLVARSGTRAEHRIEDAAGRWSWVAGNPIDRDSYVYAWERGSWPDGTPTVAVEAAPAAGDNLPSDPFARLQAELDDKLASAKAFLEEASARQDKTRADRARNLQAELLQLNRAADKLHEAEKAPHLQACRDVDAKFRFRDTVKEVAARLRTVFENIAKRLEAEANEAARREHERKLREAEEQRRRIEAERAKLHEDDPISALTSPEPELPPLPAAPEPVKVSVGGGIGRAAGLKTVLVPEIIDFEATLRHYAKHPEVRAVVEKLVKAEARLHKEATSVPGVRIKEERRAA